jgi:hypothetical protein
MELGKNHIRILDSKTAQRLPDSHNLGIETKAPNLPAFPPR